VQWILDTDVVTIMSRRSQPAYDRLAARLRQHAPADILVTIINVQEEFKGWTALLNKAKTPEKIVWAYWQLEASLRDFCRGNVLPFNQAAQDRFTGLQKQCSRIGTRDLRIASIALATGSSLVTRNLRDFRRVPGLVIEDWTL